MERYFRPNDDTQGRTFYRAEFRKPRGENVLRAGFWANDVDRDFPKNPAVLAFFIHNHICQDLHEYVDGGDYDDSQAPSTVASPFLTVFGSRKVAEESMQNEDGDNIEGMKLYKISGEELAQNGIKVLRMTDVFEWKIEELGGESEEYLVWKGIPGNAIARATAGDVEDDPEEEARVYPAGEYKITKVLKHRPVTATTKEDTDLYFVQWMNSWNYPKDLMDGKPGHKAIDDYWKEKTPAEGATAADNVVQEPFSIGKLGAKKGKK